MKNIVIKSLGMIMAFSLVISCETLELESLIENPNSLGLSSASPDFVLNEMQLDFRNLNRTIGGGVDNSMRMEVLASTYNAVTSTTAMNGEWTSLYNFNANFNVLESIAEKEGLGFHLGMAQIMKAALFVNVVDLIGEAVYTEANDPSIPKPTLDSGESIYTAMYDLIDEGIANLKSGAKRPVNDLYYDGDAAAWVRFANSFKIKMLLTTRLVTAADSKTKIDAILAGGEYIQNNSQDFEFQYGVTAVVNESRHPLMSGSYTTGAAGYRPNNLISYMKDSSAVQDPRLRYYFYRQTLDGPTGTQLTCDGAPNFTFCYTGDGYWGRDHGDDSAAPADGLLRTVYGAYPAAGAYDNDQGEPVTVVSNLGGDGIH
ncbi:SusD/RagB family nutrient-binding outer membrane lipoprotein, partial [Roseivirga echinicomitans]|uniref:SusD/RagB family nutrient-binding outer membrane lipoprotein n=1 Tax=Roseivirga echinicomitans TaxID=296218 RepID=UPI000A84629E